MKNLFLETEINGEIQSHPIVSENTAISISETLFCRFMCEGLEEDYELYIGGLKLEKFQINKVQLVFFSNAGKLNPGRYFCQNFLNHSGFSEIQLFFKNEIIQEIKIEIVSKKATTEDLYRWILEIQDVFPISKFAPIISPMSSLDASNNIDGFLCFSDYVKELRKLVKIQIENISKERFLKLDYKKSKQFHSENIQKNFNSHDWVTGKVIWRQIRSTRDNLVKKANAYFEPLNQMGTILEQNYKNRLNGFYYYMIWQLKDTVEFLIQRLDQISIQTLQIRNTQFENEINKIDLINYHKEYLIKSLIDLNSIVSRLNYLGVKMDKDSIDFRFPAISNAIKTIERFIEPLKNYQSFSSELLGLPSVDLLFEYFSYSKIIKSFIALGFEIFEIGSCNPLPFFIRLRNKKEGLTVTVFYDQTIPKYNRGYFYHPLVDYSDKSSYKRPDFILDFEKNNHHVIAIIDAKFKILSKCRSDHFSKIKSDNLMAKYSTGMGQVGRYGLPPIFVGAICLNDDTRGKSKYHPIFEGLSDCYPLVSSGIISIGYGGDEDLSQFIEKLIIAHNDIRQSYRYTANIDFLPPQPEPSFTDSRLENRNEIEESNDIVSWHHHAYSLKDEDVAVVKGMLLRGDKPQDIAMYYGVNSGRISEIKNGVRFSEIKARLFDLPPPGPYPSVRDFLLRELNIQSAKL